MSNYNRKKFNLVDGFKDISGIHLLKGDNNLSKYLFDSCEKAYDHYIKNQEKKWSNQNIFVI